MPSNEELMKIFDKFFTTEKRIFQLGNVPMLENKARKIAFINPIYGGSHTEQHPNRLMYTYSIIHNLYTFADCLKASQGVDDWFNQSLDYVFDKQINIIKERSPFGILPGIIINVSIKLFQPVPRMIEYSFRNDCYDRGMITHKLLDENLLFNLLTDDKIQIVFDIILK